jgi:hypothetical protein
MTASLLLTMSAQRFATVTQASVAFPAQNAVH